MHPSRVGALIHGSVCRDHLEPATACRVHHGLGLAAEALICDVSNACLGLINGLLQVANMIELGQIEAGLVVGTEGSRQLLESTIAWLNRQTSLSRGDIKQAVASLTIGSGSCAVLLVDQRISQAGSRLVAGCARAESQFHGLCQSGRDQAMDAEAQPLMWTDSEQLLHRGVATAAATFRTFLQETGWSRDQLDRVVCHQVGSAHQKLLLEALELDGARDFVTYPWLGNTGSVALPMSLAIACQEGHIGPGHRVGLLGIGSGINCLMVGCQWNASRVMGGTR
jgi:3-oxoacyl-[acyl-carrier-protein] synthase-3